MTKRYEPPRRWTTPAIRGRDCRRRNYRAGRDALRSASWRKYPREVVSPSGHAGQTKDELIQTHQVRTVDLARVTTCEIGSKRGFVTDAATRSAVREALADHLGLDGPRSMDGAAAAR